MAKLLGPTVHFGSVLDFSFSFLGPLPWARSRDRGQGQRQAQAADVLCFLPNNHVIGGKLVQREVQESSKGLFGGLCACFLFMPES